MRREKNFLIAFYIFCFVGVMFLTGHDANASCDVMKAANAYNTGNYQQAIEYYKLCFDEEYDPRSDSYNLHSAAEDLAYVANAHYYLKHYDEAIALAKRSIEIAPNHVAYRTLAMVYTDKKQYDEAIDAYKKAIELFPLGPSPVYYYRMSIVYDAKGDLDNAIASGNKAQELAPENANILFNIAWLYMKAGKFDNAIESVNKAIALETITGIGTNIAIENNYPVVKGLTENAPAMRAGVQVGDRIIKINGQSTKGWTKDKFSQNTRGEEGTEVTITIEREGLDKPVEKTIKRQKILTENLAGPLGMRSLLYIVKGDYEKAINDSEMAYSLNPNNTWSKSAKSYSYIIAGKPEEAIKILSSIKDSPFDRLLECLAYSKKGDLKKSAEIYASIPEDYLLSKNALRQYFKNAVLNSLISYVETKKESVKNLETKGQYREALKEYADLLKIADQTKRKEILGHVALLLKKKPYLMELPEESRKYALRAEVMTKEGKFDEAVKEYKEAIKIAPFYPLLYRAIALNYAELKDYKKAIENMNTYIELYPDAFDVREAKDEIYKWEFMMEKGGK